jgi:hypothetical protein
VKKRNDRSNRGLPRSTGLDLTMKANVKHWLESLGPYQSLALLAVPVCLVEPSKLIAIAVAGEGYWITATAMIVVAYAGSLLLVERVFQIVKPKVLQLRWFAKLWAWLIVRRYKLVKQFRRV